MLRRLDDALKRAPAWRRLRSSARLRALLGFEETIWTRKIVDQEVRNLVGTLGPSRLRAQDSQRPR